MDLDTRRQKDIKTINDYFHANVTKEMYEYFGFFNTDFRYSPDNGFILHANIGKGQCDFIILGTSVKGALQSVGMFIEMAQDVIKEDNGAVN